MLGRARHLRVSIVRGKGFTDATACGRSLGNKNMLRTDDHKLVDCLICAAYIRRLRRPPVIKGS